VKKVVLRDWKVCWVSYVLICLSETISQNHVIHQSLFSNSHILLICKSELELFTHLDFRKSSVWHLKEVVVVLSCYWSIQNNECTSVYQLYFLSPHFVVSLLTINT
jgi:hypothetical protein